mmetsp:Transcript_25286/g.37335  ORF Transcript_25286/g.37335 Transcript_25286/m.37335 type:complete len:217 (+) Transcript_25286:136-786(+)
MSEVPTCEITLPTGRLGLALKDQRQRQRPVVSSVMKRSKLYGRLKPGYIFQTLTLGDGSVIDCQSSELLVSYLIETSYDPNRKVKMEMAYPDSVTIRSRGHEPIGMHISTREGKPVVLDMGERPGGYREEVRDGMIVHTVINDDGYEITGGTALDIAHAVKTSCSSYRLRHRGGGCHVILRDPAIEMPPLEIFDPRGTRCTTRMDSSGPTLQDFAP